MNTLGVIGGMSWESTALYYRLLNEGVRDRLGGLHSAPLLLHSTDFASIAALQRSGDWAEAGRQLASAAEGLARAGATAVLLATNTMHKVAPMIEAATAIPLLHIGDAIGRALQAGGYQRPLLLGTAFTMREPFLRDYLSERYAVEVMVPSEAAQVEIDRAIFAELCQGRFTEQTRAFYRQVLVEGREAGADAAILGCTEIGLLLATGERPLPLIDSAVEHVQQGLDWLLGARGQEAE